MSKEVVAILGGTGEQDLGLAYRFAAAPMPPLDIQDWIRISLTNETFDREPHPARRASLGGR